MLSRCQTSRSRKDSASATPAKRPGSNRNSSPSYCTSAARLSAWERDKNKRGVSFNDLHAIATHTGMPLEFFLGGDVRFTALTDVLTDREGRLAALYAMPSLFSGDDYLVAA